MAQETPTPADRQDLPGSSTTPATVEDVLSSLRGVLDSMERAQAEGRRALESALERLQTLETAPTSPRVVGVEHSRREPTRRPEAPRRVHGRDETTTEPDDPVGTWLQPAPWQHPRTRPESAESPAPKSSAPQAATPAAATTHRAPDAKAGPARSTALRHTFVGLQRRAHELDRFESPEAIQTFLWDLAKQAGVRGMLLQEKGRALYAEDAFHFDNFAGERRGRLRKVVVPYDPDGLFGATAQDRAPYSGPRPARGIPVDLILVMGKQAPDWCLVVPMPYRNRWGTFLYFDATGDRLDALLELEVVARLAVLQLRAARYRQHEPADRIRAFRSATLRDRKRKKAVRRGTLSDDPNAKADAAAEEKAEEKFDPLSKKKRPTASLVDELDADRFDADGNLVRPLDGGEILARIGELPSMPHVATRLIGLLNDPETEIRQLQEILSTDQAISVRLLQIANSSLYGNMREVSNIGEAIVRLGFTAIRSWLLSTVTRQLFVGDGSNASTMALWRQSVLCAMAAELVAEHEGRMDPEVAFVGGLLQNIGLLVLARSHADVFEEIDTRARAAQQPYVELERRVLGFDHADIGGILLQRWGLGDSLVSAVSAHHRVTSVRTDDDRFAAVIALAEELALRLGGGPTETCEDDLSEHEVAIRLGIGSDVLQVIEERLAERALDRQLFED